ncbi:MAG: 4Fe-4S binding protein [Deltaproteobacteria bacterium]|nr:4Fe-4S binding protein [Deltaproteobacteria bacterium]
MRRTLQIIFLILFLALITLSAWPHLPVAPELFLQASPLIAGLSSLAARTFTIFLLPAIVILATALIAGRIFCAYTCPLGTLFDLCGRRQTRAGSIHTRVPKYLILCALLAAAAAGVNFTGLFDPLALLYRSVAFVLYPLSILGVNLGLDALRPAAEHFRWLSLAYAYVAQPVFIGAWLSALIILCLFVLNRFAHRFWCRSLCPLGALLGIFARMSLVKRQVSSACTSCGACVEPCPLQAIPADRPQETIASECSLCGTCAKVCPQDAISYGLQNRVPVSRQALLSKRSFIAAAGLGLTAAGLARLSPREPLRPAGLLRPPGAVPEKEFLQRCVRCGACMRVCPTNTLQPLLFERGLENLWTPRLVPRLAGCDQSCFLCGTVCPTDALRELTLEEKKHAKIGTAYIVKDRCLVWAQDRLCLICDEQCPYNAIIFQWKDGFRRPVVIEHKCNGCGFCEEQCPVAGESAIIVTYQGEIRLSQGSYIEAARQQQLDFSTDPDDDEFFLQPERFSPEDR